MSDKASCSGWPSSLRSPRPQAPHVGGASAYGPSEGRGWFRACVAGCSPGVLRLVARQPRMSLLISQDPTYPTMQGDFQSSDPWQLVDLPGLLRGFATIPGFIAQFIWISFMTPLPAVKSGAGRQLWLQCWFQQRFEAFGREILALVAVFNESKVLLVLGHRDEENKAEQNKILLGGCM